MSSDEIRRQSDEPVREIIDAVRTALEQTPPELSADIVDKGIVIAGGGAFLSGLDRRMQSETGLPAIICDDPLTAVVNGCGKAL